VNNRVLWLRISYWTGAIIDAFACVPMWSTKVFAIYSGVRNFNPGWDFRYAMAFGSALMAGWTVLLVWADRKPLERRGVLLITVFPVIVGLNVSRYLLYLGGYLPTPFPLQSLVLPAVLTALFLFSYVNSFRKNVTAGSVP
jgi:hypothetical protein